LEAPGFPQHGRKTAVGDDDLFQMMSPNSLEKVNAECQGDALDPSGSGIDGI
jgi:hypothetical protein